jgi:tetratricopeptide (TPR) repeat protein
MPKIPAVAQPTNIAPRQFLDVDELLNSSRPTPRLNLFWPFIGAMIFLVLLQLGGRSDAATHQIVQLVSGLAMVGMVTASICVSVYTVKSMRRQQQTVEAIEEMMQLRRWEPAGMLLDRFLSSPVRSPRVWATALVRLAELLGRYARYEDAMAVQNFLIDNELLDESSEYFLRLGRAIAMLREDHLVDADRAISDLRRRGPRDGGGLALVEMFRDVKTGHPDEAIEIYGRSQLALRQQLGHRVSDAHALAALAFDLQRDAAAAQMAYEKATLLAPLAELQRRYPDLLKLADKYTPAPAPKEAA